MCSYFPEESLNILLLDSFEIKLFKTTENRQKQKIMYLLVWIRMSTYVLYFKLQCFHIHLKKQFKYLLCVYCMFNDILCRENLLPLKEVFIQLGEKHSNIYLDVFLLTHQSPRNQKEKKKQRTTGIPKGEQKQKSN